MTTLPQGPLVGFYGDDFTGSTAVAEVLSFAGLPTVLFLDVPTAAQLEAFKGYRGIGIAGVARSKSPAWMETNLPAAFDFLATLAAPIAHYKICSTLDSAPHVGSIGRAAELAAPRLGGSWHPLLIAAPGIARYQAFGNLFALVDGQGFRLDRHPTMSRHPVTPMNEADVRLHLQRQTKMPIGLIDLVALKSGIAEAQLEKQLGGMVALDVVDEDTLREAGRLIWQNRGQRLLAIGSLGVEYALVAWWRAAGLLNEPKVPQLRPAEHVAVVSGSCSPVTARQIERATQAGYRGIRVDVARAVDPGAWPKELARVAALALEGLSLGHDPLAFTASGPNDAAIPALRTAIETSGADAELIHERIGRGLGTLLQEIMQRAGVTRAVIAGGDSSGHAALAMGIRALTALAPVAPGAMLCAAHRASDTIELALKGGQMGGPDYLTAVRGGRSS